MLRTPVLAALACATLVAAATPALGHPEPPPGDDAVLLPLPGPEREVQDRAMTLEANVDTGAGSSLALATIGGRDVAFVGTLGQGLHVLDVTDPGSPHRTFYDCPGTPGDVEVFDQGARVLATYTATEPLAGHLGRRCAAEAQALGAELDGSERGTFLLDVTAPRSPRVVSFLESEQAYEMTAHPSGDLLYGATDAGALTVHDVSDPARPRRLPDVTLPGPVRHVTFDRLGTRAWVATGSTVVLLDTTDPQAPRELTRVLDPALAEPHQAGVVASVDVGGRRHPFLVVADAGGAGPDCPAGALVLYDVDGDRDRGVAPLTRVADWRPEPVPGVGGPCGAHLFQVSDDERTLAIAWREHGVRLLDVSQLPHLAEIGHYAAADSDAWAFGFLRTEGYGGTPLWAFTADAERGFDVVRWASPEASVGPQRPEDLAAAGCDGVPETVLLHDRNGARPAHRHGVDCVAWRGIAEGTGGQNLGERLYGPTDQLTRGQMATFLVRTLRASGFDTELPEPDHGAFDDTAGSVHAESIAVLAAAGVVHGDGARRYDPRGPVTRAQMASFVVRTAQVGLGRALAQTGGRRFADVPPGSPHDVAIETGADAGLFAGTSATTFTPGTLVLRDQMATFLTRLLDVLDR